MRGDKYIYLPHTTKLNRKKGVLTVALIRLAEQQIIKACVEYRRLCEAGEIKRADWWHFSAWCCEAADALSLIVKHGGRAVSDDAPDEVREAAKYAEAADELRRLSTYIRGQYTTAPAWGGASASKAMFLLRQDWDGAALTDRPDSGGGAQITVKLVGDFGGTADPFA